jgi:ABC-type spermidine/putrescine transport system permease subunit I
MATRIYRTSRPVGKRSRFAVPGALLAAPIGWMVLFYLIPITILLVHAFWSVKYPDIDHSLTLTNFRTLLTRDVYARILFRTALMAFAVTLADIALAFPLAFWLAKRVRRNRELLLFLVIFPLWSSYLVRIFAWKTLLGTTGILNSFLLWTGVLSEPVSFFLYSKWSIFLALTHVWLPFMILPLFTVLDRIPDSLLEASSDLGAGWFATFRTVVLPLSRPGLLAGGLATFSLTMGDYIAPTLLGGPGDQMIGKIVADQFGVADNWPLGAALIIPVLVLISLLLIFSNRAGAMERTAM